MRGIEKWVKREGFNYDTVKLDGERDCIRVFTPYEGLYPGKEQFDALEKVRKYIRRFHPEKTVVQRGHYSAVYIY